MRPDDTFFKLYQLDQKISPYRDMENSIRETFLKKLIENKIISHEELEEQIQDFFKNAYQGVMTEKIRKDYRDLLISYYFVSS
ncbi:MAG: hypothetical protein JEY91_16550, partial [Spirochaetaceae bacterium]|nr:hypothetical protein [Spirochaetaceae bacterium]